MQLGRAIEREEGEEAERRRNREAQVSVTRLYEVI